MDVKFRCSQCFRKIAAGVEYKGQKINCPACNKELVVPAASFSIGRVIQGFTIEQFLGSGAMGEVYLAKQETMNRDIALKIMTFENMQDEDDRQRFVREVQTLAKLNHPNIVSAISAGEFEEGSYLAMSYVNGSTVEDIILKDGPIAEKESLRCVTAVADALKYAWDNHKVLHRDIKPANFMIDSENEIHLMDMGIAKSMDSDYDITVAGMVMGTPYYMSPEQAAADTLDQQSDIYSLGASLYHMLAGEPPYKNGSPMQIMADKLSKNPKDPKSVNPNISDRMCSLIKKFMAIDKEKRVKNWDEALELLKKAQAPKKKSQGKKIQVNAPSVSTPRVKSGKVQQKKSPLPAIIIIVLIGIIAAVFISMSK